MNSLKLLNIALFYFCLPNLLSGLTNENVTKPSFNLYFIILVIIIIILLLLILLKKNKNKDLNDQLISNTNLISASKDLLCILSPNWTFIQVNPAFGKVLEYDKFESIGKNFIEFIDPDEKESYYLIKNNLKNQERYSFEIKMQTKSTTYKWISWYCFLDPNTKNIYASGRDKTNEKKVFLQLEQSEERARKQFKSVPVPTYTWKRQGDNYILIDYNDMVYKMTEGKVNQLLGINASDLLKNNYQVLRDMDYCYITRKPVQKEIEFFVEDNNEKRFYISSYAFVPPDSVMIHLEDITQRKLIETELRDNEEKYRALFNSTTDAIVLVDLNGKIADCNIATSKLFLYSTDEIKNKEISSLFNTDYIKPSDNPNINEVEELIIQLFGMDVVDGFVEVNCLKKNNSKFPAEMQAQFFRFKDNRMVLLYIRDITERKEMELALKDSSSRLKVAFENLPFDFWITDYKLTFLMQSKNSHELWGNLISYNLDSAPLPDVVKKQLLSDCPKALAGDPIIHVVSYNEEGVNKTFHQMLVPVYSDNKLSGLLGVNMDITENRRKEEELKKYSNDLERMNQELKSFAYIVSHDLKAPLRAITTLVEWIVTDYDSKIDDEGKNILSLLTNRTKRMHDLIDGILKYSRVGRLDVPVEEFSLYDLVNNICNMLVVPDNVQVIIQKELPVICSGKVYIEQIFQNLISNALKFMDKPQGLIEIGFTEIDNFYRIYIKDNGPGIEEKYFDKIFQIFQTLKPRDEFESTGVGLSIVKKIVENYNGKIWVESSLNQGSCFYFTLPKEDK